MEKFTPELLGVTLLSLLITVVGGSLWVAREPIIEWLGSLFHRYAYVAREDEEIDRDDRQFSAFEPSEPPLFVPPVQLTSGAELPPLDLVRLDTLARLMAAGTVSESAAITVVWDGTKGAIKVSKGGSKAYMDRRDALRLMATAYGWKAPEPTPAPEPPRVVMVNAGRPEERHVALD